MQFLINFLNSCKLTRNIILLAAQNVGCFCLGKPIINEQS